jgi:hypothetical protein
MTRRQVGVLTLAAITAVIAVVLVMAVGRGSPPPQSQTSPSITGFPTLPAQPSTGTHTPPPVDVKSLTRLADILNTMHQDAFNAQAPSTKGSSLPGGLYINWRGDWDGDPSTASDNTNIQTSGSSDDQTGASPRHDPVVDLMYLRNLRAFMYYAPNDHSFDGDAARMDPIVRAEFAGYTYYRSWIYFQLLDLNAFQPHKGWDVLAEHFVQGVYHGFYNSAAGTIIDKSHNNYRTDFAAESAAAFADAGARFNDSAMTAAAKSITEHLLTYAQDPNTHLYPLQMNYQQGGDAVGQAQIKIGEQAQTLDALLTVYDHVRIPQILTAVKAAVDEMYNPALGLHDSLNGGFFYSVDYDGKGLQSAYKESRQAWMVQLLGHLDADAGGQAQRLADMTAVVANKMWQNALHGYVYRTSDNWGVYTNHSGPNHTAVDENFVTSEAMGIAGNVLAPSLVVP